MWWLMSSKLRVVGLLLLVGVAFFSLKPFVEVHFSELKEDTSPTDMKKPKVPTNATPKPIPKIDLKVTSAVFSGVPVRMYRPTMRNTNEKSLLPAVVYFHGGAWMHGSVDGYDLYTRKIATNTGLLVISVEYRLAPQHPFPVPLDDCHKVALYVLNHASELDVEASKVILMGDSAGGNLAAVVSQRMKNIKPPLLAQVLINPVTQSLNFQLPSHKVSHGGDGLAAMYLSYFMGSYNNSLIPAMISGSHVSDGVHQRYSQYVDYLKLPESLRKDYVAPRGITVDPVAARVLEPFITNPEINPLMSDDLKGLPHTMVVTVGTDPFRDEGVLYAVRLKEERIPVQHKHYEDAFHNECIYGRDTGPDSVPYRMNFDIFEFIHSRVSTKQAEFK